MVAHVASDRIDEKRIYTQPIRFQAWLSSKNSHEIFWKKFPESLETAPSFGLLMTELASSKGHDCLHYTEPLFVSTWKTLRHSMIRNGPELKQVVHTGYSWKWVAISWTFSIVCGCLIYCGPSNLEIAMVTRLTTFKTVDLPTPKALATFPIRPSSAR